MKSLHSYSDPSTLLETEPLRLAKLLSLSVPEDFDEVALARKVAKGLPPRSVTALIEVLDIDRSEIIGPVIPRGTLQRLAKTGRPLSREYSERIYSLGRVIDAVGRAYHGDPNQVKGFLYRPHQMLGGDTPLHLARSICWCRRCAEPARLGGCRRLCLTNPRQLPSALTGYRIGDANGTFPVYSAEGARRNDRGRWHRSGDHVIYASEHYSTAMLETLVRWSGALPSNQHYVEITVPAGISYEVVTDHVLPAWHHPTRTVARKFGHAWYDQHRSAISTRHTQSLEGSHVDSTHRCGGTSDCLAEAQVEPRRCRRIDFG